MYMSFLLLKMLWDGRTTQVDLEEDFYTSAGITRLALMIIVPANISWKRHIMTSSFFQATLEEDLHISAGAIEPAALMTAPSTILCEQHIINSSFSKLSSVNQSKLPSTRRHLFVVQSFEFINLPKLFEKLIGKSNVKSISI